MTGQDQLSEFGSGLVEVGTGPVTAAQVVAVARSRPRVRLAAAAVDAITASRSHVDALAGSGTPVYGVSTGFGALATRHIEPELRAQLQRSLVRSHAASTGSEIEAEVVRAMMLLRLSTLASGRTGIRPETATTYARLIDAGITPIVREHGSLGCSGDLAPLAHAALAVMWEGDVRDAEGVRCDAAVAMAAATSVVPRLDLIPRASCSLPNPLLG